MKKVLMFLVIATCLYANEIAWVGNFSATNVDLVSLTFDSVATLGCDGPNFYVKYQLDNEDVYMVTLTRNQIVTAMSGTGAVQRYNNQSLYMVDVGRGAQQSGNIAEACRRLQETGEQWFPFTLPTTTSVIAGNNDYAMVFAVSLSQRVGIASMLTEAQRAQFREVYTQALAVHETWLAENNG